MKNKLIIKGLVFGIIVLFIGTSASATSINLNQNKAKDKDYTAPTTNAPIYNLIGGVNITFGTPGQPHAVSITWWKVTDRNFIYPILPGNTICVNYTLRIRANSTGFFFIPRLVKVTTLCLPDKGNGSVSAIIPFWRHSPGFDRNITVTCIPVSILYWPPHIPMSFGTFDEVSAFTFPPVKGDGESSPKVIHINFTWIVFWAVLP